MPRKHIPHDSIADCQRVGVATLNNWLDEHNIKLPTKKLINFFDRIDKAIEEGILTIKQLNQAIAEIEENSDKKIYLLQCDNFKQLKKNKSATLKDLAKRFGYRLNDEVWVTGKPQTSPTIINFYWEEKFIKIKLGEKQFVKEFDSESDGVVKTPKMVFVVYIIDTTDGLVQIRLDSPGNSHIHKNSDGRSTEAEYDNFYRQHLNDMFPDLTFRDLNINNVANHIATNELTKFRLTKGITTITNNAKQTFATSSTKTDVRHLPEYEAAASKAGNVWLMEDLTGYWVADVSDNDLKRDLFMRISRRTSQIRVQRGCLEKELNYGIRQIREIQKAV